MRFACLVYVDPRTAFDGSAASIAVLESAEKERQKLLAQGVLTEALMLPDPAMTATVRVRGGKMSRTDGPFMETKEVLAGFVLIEAPDLAAAVSMAAENPMARLGAVEIRPLVDFSQPRPRL